MRILNIEIQPLCTGNIRESLLYTELYEPAWKADVNGENHLGYLLPLSAENPTLTIQQADYSFRLG